MISILMATYNGERYVAEQIESLLRQTEQGFILYIHDDRSTDKTRAIVQSFADRYPGKIFLHENETNSGGAKWNFLDMMCRYRDDYVMLCDQDDVWLPDKIQIQLAAMRQAEAAYGQDSPILVHTDLTVVDGQLKPVHSSFRKMTKLDYRRTELKDQLVQNTLTGCTAMLNRALQDYITDVPDGFSMHDGWLMLVAAAFGKVIPLMDERPILYRQHGDNAIGAMDAGSAQYLIDRSSHIRGTKDSVEQTYRQAASLLRVYSERLSNQQKKLLESYCAIPQHGKLRRIYDMFHLQTRKHGFMRVLGQIVYI